MAKWLFSSCLAIFVFGFFLSCSSLCFVWATTMTMTIHSPSMDVMFESRIQNEAACVDINMRIFSVTRTKNLSRQISKLKKWDINRISITVFFSSFLLGASTACVLYLLPWTFFTTCMANENVWICEYKENLRMKKVDLCFYVLKMRLSRKKATFNGER